MKTIKEILVDTKQFLQDNTWIQNKLEDNKGGYCLLGAMYKLEGSALAYKHLCDQLQIGIGGLSIWNDKPGRTKEQVLELLDKAIENAS